MAQLAPVELARQQLQKLAKIRFVKFLGRRELPEHRTQAITEFQHAGIVEPFDRIAGLPQYPAIGGETRPLYGKHKTVGHLARPFAEAFRLLRALVRAIDLDRGAFGRGVFQLLPLRQLLRIDPSSPWREGPSADSDVDFARAF